MYCFFRPWCWSSCFKKDKCGERKEEHRGQMSITFLLLVELLLLLLLLLLLPPLSHGLVEHNTQVSLGQQEAETNTEEKSHIPKPDEEQQTPQRPRWMPPTQPG